MAHALPAFVPPAIGALPTQSPEEDDMAVERTFSMIKPDATKRNLTGKIVAKLEEAGLRVVAQKRVWMSRKQAEGFYAVHKGRPVLRRALRFHVVRANGRPGA